MELYLIFNILAPLYVQSSILCDNNSIIMDLDPDDIADKICYYLEHTEELAEIRKRGMQFANDTSWEKEGDKVVAVVKKGIEEDEKNISSRW